jgi:hypothetical protein
MFAKVLRGGRGLGCALGAWALLALTSTATAQTINGGVRWVGSTLACTAPPGWTAQPLFASPGLPASLAELCVFTWAASGGVALPRPADLAALFAASGSLDLTEDVPVVVQSASRSPEELAFLAGLRQALRARVGDASLLPSVSSPRVRVVVIDSAPDAPHGQIQAGTSRHGDTLAHLIEDIVCVPGASRPVCAAEVTSVLALEGGIGTLTQLARAIERAVSTWEHDRRTRSAPPRLVLNLSLGWEDAPGIADCSTSTPDAAAPPARAVRGILQHAAARGALIVAAAGNDSGGTSPRTGLVCPGAYQALPRNGDASESLVVAASGVDHRDHPLETARPAGITGIAGLGLGGVAWRATDPVPAPLTGSSVATAVVSAVSALVWAHRPTWSTREVTAAVYQGGVDAGEADECPRSLPSCRSRRASVCGALIAAGASPACSPAAPGAGSTPALPVETSALVAAVMSLSPVPGTIAPLPGTLPRYAAPTIQLQPWVAPMPVAETCPVCVVSANQLVIGGLEQDLDQPALVLRYADGTTQTLALAPSTLVSATPYAFLLPPPPTLICGPLKAAYVTGFAVPLSPSHPTFSIIEQIFVQP